MHNLTWGIHLFIFCVLTFNVSAQELFRFHDFNSYITDIGFSPNSTELKIASQDGTIKTIDADSGELLHTYMLQHGVFTDIEYSRDGSKYLVVGYTRFPEPSDSNNNDPNNNDETFIRVFDAANHGLIQEYNMQREKALFSPDGTKILTIGNNLATIIDLDTNELHKITSPVRSFTQPLSMDYAPNGKFFALFRHQAVTPDMLRVEIWDVEKLRFSHWIEVKPYEIYLGGGLDFIQSIKILPDSKRLITRSAEDGTIKLWDIETGIELLNFFGKANGHEDISFFPGGNYFLADHNNETKVWNVRTGELTHTLTGLLDNYYHSRSKVRVSEDGRMIAVSTYAEVIMYRNPNLHRPPISVISQPISNHGIRTLYQNKLDGDNTTAFDHGLSIIPGGFSNADFGQLRFGPFQGLQTTEPGVLENRRASNLEGMTVTVEPNQVMLVTAPEITSGNPVVFQCYVNAQGEGATVNIGILDSQNQEQNAVSTWSLSGQQTSWKRLSILMNSESGTYLPILQVSNSGSSNATVWIDNLHVYELPLDNSEISAFMN